MATDRPEENGEDEQVTGDEASAGESAPKDEVDEQSEQSFPASDPPAY